MSGDHAIALQPRQQSETMSQKERKNYVKSCDLPGKTCLDIKLLKPSSLYINRNVIKYIYSSSLHLEMPIFFI